MSDSLQVGNFIRTETGFAVNCPRESCRWSTTVSDGPSRTAIVDEAEAKLRAHRLSSHPLRLNLGAGEDRMPVEDGWINLDLRDDVGADMVAPAWPLVAFHDDTVAAIRALDLLEHFTRVEVPDVLADWRRVLIDMGLLTIRVPNLLALAKQLVSQSDPMLRGDADGHFAGTIENIYGGHRWGERGGFDRHEWGWTPRTLVYDLEHAGFTVLSNDMRHNMTVTAQKEGR